ncbi:hypothetical protein AAG570_002083, partial [Ranatra chinensis]
DEGGWEEDRPDTDTIDSTNFIYNAHLSLVLDEQRKRLPIFRNREHLLYLLETYQTVVLVGETGCGKSTQIPQYLLEAGWCSDGRIVGVTEPRRVAATSLATRVAEEKGSLLGDVVGYSIRFDDCTDAKTTRIKYMTEGILMREMMSDPLLRSYSAIMLDEVHERTLSTDILMGLLKKILKKRRSLKLIIASATMDAESLRDFFRNQDGIGKDKNTATIMSVEGRLYPVDIFYLREPVADYVKGVVETVVKIDEREAPGDILAFLTGQDEVDRAVSLLMQYSPSQNKSSSGCKMYGSLTNSEQVKIFRHTPRGMRKIVIATNIAETSITIPGIAYVVDCGYVKMKWFDPESYTESLVVVPVSQASAEQRAGRAGRVRNGKAYRLYTEESFNNLEADTPCEMRRCELSGVVLQLKALGIDNVVRFSFPSAPPARALLSGVELLHALGAITEDGELTDPIGTRMAEFPLGPLHAKALLASCEMGCSEEMACLLALLQVKSVFLEPGGGAAAIRARVAHRKFLVEEGDLLSYLNAFASYNRHLERGNSKEAISKWCHENFLNRKAFVRVQRIRSQIASLLKSFNLELVSCKDDTEKVGKCITAGFFANAAYLHSSGSYRTVRGEKELHIHPSSVLYTLKQPQWVVYCETVHTQRLYMRELTVVKPIWLHELAPHFYHITVDR